MNFSNYSLAILSLCLKLTRTPLKSYPNSKCVKLFHSIASRCTKAWFSCLVSTQWLSGPIRARKNGTEQQHHRLCAWFGQVGTHAWPCHTFADACERVANYDKQQAALLKAPGGSSYNFAGQVRSCNGRLPRVGWKCFYKKTKHFFLQTEQKQDLKTTFVGLFSVERFAPSCYGLWTRRCWVVYEARQKKLSALALCDLEVSGTY